ncbi:MAG: hypothetical protein U5N55_01545 [Cypionkella sp.]|nr:hypothetical protein [Cypionkella sp.]
MGKFAADVSALVNKSKDRIRRVATDAIQDVMDAAQQPQLGITKGATSFVVGKIPVAEGELRGSLRAELLGGGAAIGPDSYAVVLAGYEVGMNMKFTWTAPHALPMELGFTARNGRQVPGRFFVGANAARFSEFVASRVAEVNAL